ncbi:superoxide dismutase [Mn], mitochondrial [Bradysia coprophila]|uniref:superoxide dismutase [Mn], mitochondrial n=1 Tax=Bradysia coprophila TaxID=38358 RepID=UPI00187D7E80|nr:superoxide dismutase [Mn], mitochondrial [Bradysia coprophila]
MLSLRQKITPIGNVVAGFLRSKHTLPELPYDYKALEPIICAEIMELHHKKHHQAYVTNYNAAEEQLADAVQKSDTTKIVGLQNALRFNGGGHLNHDIFWKNLTPKTTNLSPELKSAVETTYGDFETFKKTLITTTTGVQGSGWGWLGYNKLTKSLQITTCANQDPLQATTGLIPLLGIDVWEHAYYLQYKNVRPDYVEAIFDIINWNDVSARFAAAKA